MGLVGLALLVAFAGRSWAAPSPPPTSEDRARTNGYVFVRVITNAARVSAKFNRFTELSVSSRTEKGKSYSLLQSGIQLRAQAFAAWLPPGEYELSALGAEAMQGMFKIDTGMDLRSLLPPFQVVQGQRTDLGTLIFQPVGEGKAVIIPVASNAENAEVFAQTFPADAPVFANTAPLAWEAAQAYRFE